MKKILATLATASTIVVGSALIAPSAEAVTITLNVNGIDTDYDVSTLTGTFVDNRLLLESQPWFGSQTLAEEAANQTGTSLGTQNRTEEGPYFVFSFEDTDLFFPLEAERAFFGVWAGLPSVSTLVLFDGGGERSFRDRNRSNIRARTGTRTSNDIRNYNIWWFYDGYEKTSSTPKLITILRIGAFSISFSLPDTPTFFIY